MFTQIRLKKLVYVNNWPLYPYKPINMYLVGYVPYLRIHLYAGSPQAKIAQLLPNNPKYFYNYSDMYETPLYEF